MAVKKKVSTLAEPMHGGQNSSHLQSHTDAVYIATRSAWVRP